MLSLTDNTIIEYFVDEYYSNEHERTIRFDDPQINIIWGINNPILSEKDSNALFVNELDYFF